MARTRQVLLVRLLPVESEERPSILNCVPLGTFRGVAEALGDFNTFPDGSKSPESFGVLYGPGFTVQMPMAGADDPVGQVMVTLEEEDVAWPVLSRVCRTLGWKMMDPRTGRVFSA